MRTIALATATAAFAIASVSTASAIDAPINLADVPDHKVAICHFPGHDGDFAITGQGFGCEEQGGNILIVGKRAADRGHGVEPDTD